MTRINLGEMNELALSVQSMRYNENIAEEMEREKQERTVINSNVTAKRDMASELMLQGFTEETICRILNISQDQLPEPLPL